MAYCNHILTIAKQWSTLVECSGLPTNEDASGAIRPVLKTGEAWECFRWVYAVNSPYHGAWSIVVGIYIFVLVVRNAKSSFF
jgi:hypothetical protein